MPDTIRASFEFEVPLTSLSPGKYRAEMALIDPWSGNIPTRPFTCTANSIDLTLGDAQERIAYLRNVEQDLPGLLEHVLATESEPYRRHRALELGAIYGPALYLAHSHALLTLQENASSAEMDGSFDILGEPLAPDAC